MANQRTLKIIVQVQNAGATKKLRGLEKQVRRTDRSIKDSSKNVMKFNRALFTTAAFAGMFIKAFQGVGNAMRQAGDLGLIEQQYERVLGPGGTLMQNIRSFTDTGINRFEAMKAGIQLGNLGISKNSRDTAKILAMSAAAARRAGLKSGEGLKKFTEFLKTGNAEQLKNLDLLKISDPMYKAYIGRLGQIKGGMSGAVKSQYLLKLGMELLARKTKGQMFGFRNLNDVLTDFGEMLQTLRVRIGSFLGKALTPFLTKITELGNKFADNIKYLTKNNKHFMRIAKVVILATGAIAGLVGVLGTLRIATIALSDIGFGLPKLITTIIAATAVFASFREGTEGVIKTLKRTGQFIQLVYQLIANFDKESGVSKVDKALMEAFNNSPLLSFAKNFARVSLIVGYFVKDVGKTLIDWGKIALNQFKKLGDVVIRLLGLGDNKKGWSRGWIEGLDGLRGGAVKGTAAVLALLGAFGAFKAVKNIFGGILGKIPGIGRLFGGKGKQPKGTATDPLYTIDARSAIGGIGSSLGKKGGFFGIPGFFRRLFRRLNGKLSSRINIPIFGIFGRQLKKLGKLFVGVGKQLWRGNWKALGYGTRIIVKNFRTLGTLVVPLLKSLGGTTLALGAAAAAGYLVGTALTKLFPQLTEIGEWAYNFLHGEEEKAAFKKTTSDQSILNKINQNRKRDGLTQLSMEDYRAGKARRTPEDALKTKVVSGQKSQVSTPYSKEDQFSKYSDLLDMMGTMKGAEKEHLQKAFSKAMKEGKEGPGILTDKEMKELKALQLQEKIADNTKKTAEALTDTRSTPTGRNTRGATGTW